MRQVVENPTCASVQDKNLPILHNQYHGCWYPGDARRKASAIMILTMLNRNYFFGPRTLGVSTQKTLRCLAKYPPVRQGVTYGTPFYHWPRFWSPRERAPEMSPTIDLIKKSHNAPVPYPQCTIHGALWVMEQVHCGMCEIDLFRKPTTLFKSLELTSIS